MKRILRFILVLSGFLSSVLSMKALESYENHTVGDFIYHLPFTQNGSVVYYHDVVYVASVAPGVELSGDVEIPETVDILGKERRVNGVLTRAFANQTEMTSISFPKYSGENAAEYGTAAYGVEVFQGCSSLKRIEIPIACLSVSQWFKGCTSLEEVTILGCEGNSEIEPQILTLSYDTFEDCPVKTFSFNRNISIRDYESGKCILPDVNFESISIGEEVTFIPSGLFTGREDITTFSVPENVENIYMEAFLNCTNLTQLDLGKVQNINEDAFTNCPLSETLVIPGSVCSMTSSFRNCENVRRLEVEPSESYLSIKETLFEGTQIESAYFDRNFTNLFNRPAPFPYLTSVEFGDSVITLPAGLIASSPIEEIVFGARIKSFEEQSIPSGLVKLVMPASVEEIKNNAVYSSMPNLEEIVFEDGEEPLAVSYRTVGNIAHPMFENAPKLRKIYIGRNLKYDRYVSLTNPDLVSSQQLYSPFRDLHHPVYVTVGSGVTWMDPDMFYDSKYSDGTSVARIAMPEGITLNDHRPYIKCIYPRDAEITDGVIFDAGFTKLYWVDVDYEGEIQLPESVKEVGSDAMRNCQRAYVNTLPSQLEKIGDYAFDTSGVSFTHLILPATLKELGIEAFVGCKIDSVTVNSGLERIGQNSLARAKHVVYNAVRAELIKNGNDKSPLFNPTEISLGKDVEVIPDFFLADSWIKKLALPEGLKEIGAYSFYQARMQEINIPASVEKIGESAFEGCYALKNISFEKSNRPLTVSGGKLLDKKVKPLRVAVGRDIVDEWENPAELYVNAPATLYVGPSVTKLYAYNSLRPKKAIWDTTALPMNTQPYNLGSLANYARSESILYNAPGCVVLPYLSSLFSSNGLYYVLTSPTEAMAIDSAYGIEDTVIDIPDNIESPRGEVKVKGFLPYTFTDNTLIEELVLNFDGSIENQAFSGCTALKTVLSTGNLEKIGSNAFDNCNSLESLEFSGSVGVLGENALCLLPNLKWVLFNDLQEIRSSALAYNTSLEDIFLPDNVSAIGSSAFSGCSSLVSVVLPNSLITLGMSAFSGCTSLRELTFGSEIKEIPNYAFQNCSSLSEISIPANIEIVQNGAFNGCSSLRQFTIQPRPLPLYMAGKDNYNGALFDCPLEHVELNGDVTYPGELSPFRNKVELSTVKIGESARVLPDYIFYGCSQLDRLDINSDITGIGNGAFAGCETLSLLSLPDSLVSIGANAFQNCRNLYNVKLGRGLKTIAVNAFDGVNSLEKIEVTAIEPPICDQDALSGIDKFMCELHVPSPSVEKYRTAPQWQDFFTIKGTDIATQITDTAIESGNVKIVDGGLRLSGLEGKRIQICSLDGKITKLLEMNTEDEFIALPTGTWIITCEDYSEIMIIK